MTIHLCGPPGRSGEQPAARLALLRAGVAEPPVSPPTLVRSYRTVSPSPVPGGPGHRRSSLCCPDPTGCPVLALASALLCGAPTFLSHPGVAAVTGPTHHRPSSVAAVRVPGALAVWRGAQSGIVRGRRGREGVAPFCPPVAGRLPCLRSSPPRRRCAGRLATSCTPPPPSSASAWPSPRGCGRRGDLPARRRRHRRTRFGR